MRFKCDSFALRIDMLKAIPLDILPCALQRLIDLGHPLIVEG